MKIAASEMNLASSRESFRVTQVREELQAWVGPRPPQQPVSEVPLRQAVVVSEAARQALALDQTASAEAVEKKGDRIDPKMELLRSIIESLTGRRIEVMSAGSMAASDSEEVARLARESAQAGAAGFGVEYERSETRIEAEATRFAASGRIRTTDGREISFAVSLEMSRMEVESSQFSLRAGTAMKDPLVVNFGGEAASLSSQRFSFDLLGNGEEVDVPILGQGSGFLVLDAQESGRVTSGRQLFGPASGDGFADLAKHDADANGWIDEADPVFDRLGVWTPDAAGGGAVLSLEEARVGALYLGRVSTDFSLKDGAELGAVRSTGIYAREDGSVGTLQHVDLAV
ncbi:hypothetical protein [Zoogloea sp.]|uniref:hypothetical protein n=1 Tax=Zoogloea sp. TaxID=49181 RepID=UPI00261F2D2A|nr:hypothetical protein [Zoogloea sp.]MDD3354902.1 hypothetical protein [Zoogloea sp.]